MRKELQAKMNRSKELAEMSKKFLMEEFNFNRKIEIVWTTDSFTLNIYENNYDYCALTVKVEDDVPDFEYLKRVVEKNDEYNSLRFHKASLEEKYVIDLVNEKYKQNKDLCCFISGGCLYKDRDSETEIDLSDIEKISYDYITDMLELEETGGYRVVVDFKDNVMSGIQE